MSDRKDPKKVIAGRIGGAVRNKNPEVELRGRRELALLQAELLRRQADAIEAVVASSEDRS